MTRIDMGFGEWLAEGWHKGRAATSFAAALLVAVFVLAAGCAAQSLEEGAADVLGPHGDGTRGCEVCHVPQVGPYGGGQGAAKTTAALWGQGTAPDYGPMISLGDGLRVADVNPAAIAGGNQEVTGILLCLSCHDGNLTPQNMMQSWSYEHQTGLLARTPYREAKIPSLLGQWDEPMKDHPLGVAARIPDGNGLVWANGAFSVTPGTPYAQFVASYGLPALASGRRTSAYGINRDGEPYMLCTTCHDQHVHRVYASGPDHPIAGDGGGRVYTTYFFVNGPYNPNVGSTAQQNASSSTQFCRQCHFDMANEGNNSNGVPTVFF